MPLSESATVTVPVGAIVVYLHGAAGDLHLPETLEDRFSTIVPADPRHHTGFGAQGTRVVREVGRRTAKLRAGGQQIPEHLADADNCEAHWPYTIPSRFCICSRGTPLVSGTIVCTQTSCSTIMTAKNENT